jgi:hypothetical protein
VIIHEESRAAGSLMCESVLEERGINRLGERVPILQEGHLLGSVAFNCRMSSGLVF